MDSWTGRKRPWEEDNPIDNQPERRGSTTTAGERHAPPLPQPAGPYSRDSEALGQRRLPPLYTATCGASAERIPSGSLQLASPLPNSTGLDRDRPRAQSLFDVFQQPKRQRYESDTEHTVAFPGALDQDRCLPPIDTDAQHPRFGDPAPRTAEELTCCSPHCSGQACSTTRSLMHKLTSDLIVLDNRVRSILHKDHHSSTELPEIEHTSTAEALQWALDLVQWTNLTLRNHNISLTAPDPEQGPLHLDSSSIMRRTHSHFDREEQSPPTRQTYGPHHGYSGVAHPLSVDESRRTIYSGDMTAMGGSPHHTASPSNSMFLPPQSPMQAPQPSRPGLLPSPSSMNFPSVSNLPPISPPSTSAHNSAQATHLQELQHQVSVKTLAFQTLQREYDSLLQKLERQRTKCATLEKKFEVSDVEINSLTDEKEKLQAQVSNLESQVEDLQRSRDEARRQLVANGAQYMRIMEMANRLQAQSAEDKRRWEAEKAELERRVKVLEEAMVTGIERPTPDARGEATGSPPPSLVVAHSPHITQTPASSSSAETVNVLRAEIGRLRSRTQTLESALQTMREESISLQAAARQLVESGGKMESAAAGAIG